LMEEIDYSLLLRWFVGLSMDEQVWDATVFTKNPDRLLDADVAREFLWQVLEQGLTSEEHFTVDRRAADSSGPCVESFSDSPTFVAECRHMQVTPHVAQNQKRPGGSAIDARTARRAGYAISQRKRKRLEESCGWLKTIALMRKVRHRGIFKVGWVFPFAAAAYNLVRMRNLLCAAIPAV